MKPLFNYFLCLVLSLIFFSCSKDDDDSGKDPAPITGSISARVNPAGSATAMRVTASTTTYEVTPVNNVFTVSDIPAGQYNVTFVAATNYRAPAAKTATVTAGKNTDLGETALTKIIQTGSFSASFNGTSWSAPVPLGAFTNGNLVITATKTNSVGSTDAIVLNISNFQGMGTYSAPTDAVATYTSLSLLNPTMPAVYTSVTQCIINITKFDAAAKTVSGTFSFAAISTDLSNPATITVTNGTLTDVAFQ